MKPLPAKGPEEVFCCLKELSVYLMPLKRPFSNLERAVYVLFRKILLTMYRIFDKMLPSGSIRKGDHSRSSKKSDEEDKEEACDQRTTD